MQIHSPKIAISRERVQFTREPGNHETSRPVFFALVVELAPIPVQKREQIAPTITGNPRSAGRLLWVNHLHHTVPKDLRREGYGATEQFVPVHSNQVPIFCRNKGESAHALNRLKDTRSPAGKTPSNLEEP